MLLMQATITRYKTSLANRDSILHFKCLLWYFLVVTLLPIIFVNLNPRYVERSPKIMTWRLSLSKSLTPYFLSICKHKAYGNTGPSVTFTNCRENYRENTTKFIFNYFLICLISSSVRMSVISDIFISSSLIIKEHYLFGQNSLQGKSTIKMFLPVPWLFLFQTHQWWPMSYLWLPVLLWPPKSVT